MYVRHREVLRVLGMLYVCMPASEHSVCVTCRRVMQTRRRIYKQGITQVLPAHKLQSSPTQRQRNTISTSYVFVRIDTEKYTFVLLNHILKHAPCA